MSTSRIDFTDHDQRFKVLIREFLSEFLSLFFAEWAKRFDFTRIEWLDKEVFLDPPRGETRNLDLVAKIPVTQVVEGQRVGEEDSWIVLIHIEVEANDRLTHLRPRMHDYYKGLRDRYHLPVWSLALYLKVGRDGVGWDAYEEKLWERRILLFEYPYVGLPALEAADYVNRENILAVALAALMRVPEERHAELRAFALQRIGSSQENDVRKVLLANCVEEYLDLNEEQQREFERLLTTEPYREVRTMGITTFDKGKAEGLTDGLRLLIFIQLEERFGSINFQTRERVEGLPADQLKVLGKRILNARSLKELGLED
jgi:hypothetical protein